MTIVAQVVVAPIHIARTEQTASTVRAARTKRTTPVGPRVVFIFPPPFRRIPKMRGFERNPRKVITDAYRRLRTEYGR